MIIADGLKNVHSSPLLLSNYFPPNLGRVATPNGLIVREERNEDYPMNRFLYSHS